MRARMRRRHADIPNIETDGAYVQQSRGSAGQRDRSVITSGALLILRVNSFAYLIEQRYVARVLRIGENASDGSDYGSRLEVRRCSVLDGGEGG